MKRAIISDIHGNLEALQTVLADIQSQGITRIFCLGDVIGYGPNPRECLDLAMQFEVCVLGNHDDAAIFSPDGFSSAAERAIFWTRSQLEAAPDDPMRNQRRWQFLMQRPMTVREERMLFVHGSPRNPLNEYVFPEDVYNVRKLERLFQLVDHMCFQGHSHVPGVFTPNGRFHSPSDCDHRWPIRGDKMMVNVGSVGQPRDGDPRSCYVVLDEETIEFRRIAYPVETTVAKIYAIPELDPYLGDRLREGR
ncbi:MAG TPA: metallophosphoesterase family protein [Pirellulaceae bacterium]|nr:metallophosphoesterase family protein [Pirellulaceae bacterium]